MNPMNRWKIASSDWALVFLGGVVLPVMVVAGLFAAGRPEVAAVIGILAAIFLGILSLGAYTVHSFEAQGEQRATTLAASVISDIESVPELELVDKVSVEPPSPVTVEVAGATGVCARGFMLGDTWTIDIHGHTSRPLCKPAARALGSIIQEWWEHDPEREFHCRCPLPGQELVFNVRTSP